MRVSVLSDVSASVVRAVPLRAAWRRVDRD